MPEAITLKAVGTAITSAWERGSLLLWGIATVCIASAATLLLCTHLNLQKADALWAEYGLMLILLSVGFVILASFKTYGERKIPNLSLIANEQQSFWHHATQTDGSIITQFALRFQATNMGDTTIHLSGVKLSRPWVRRALIVDKHVHTRHPTDNTYSSRFPVMPHSLTEASAHIILKGSVGGAGRRSTMRVVIRVQDHAGRWHKLVFSQLRDPAFS
jgi:hypothetical protein